MKENTNSEYYNIQSFLDSRTKITISTAILYLIIAKLSRFIFVTEINLPPFFPAIGFAIAVVLIFGRKAILGVAMGSFLFSVGLFKVEFQNATSFGESLKPLLFCFARPLIAVLNTVLVSYLTQLWCKNKYPFNKGAHVLYFALACLLGSIVSVSVGIIPLVVSFSFPADKLILMWSNWIRGNALGAILFAPFVLAWLHKTEEVIKWSLSKKLEALALTIITVTLSLYIFETPANNESVIFFVLIWAAYRFGTKAISLLSLILTVIAVYCTSHHMGGFITNGWDDSFFLLQLFLFANMVSIMFLRGILEEKNNKEVNLHVSDQKLNIKKNVLEATIESPNGISIYALDRNFNYLSFNSTHKNNMKDQYGIEIETGDNLIECISNPRKKEEVKNIFRSVLNGNTHTKEDKSNKGEYWDILISPIKDSENNVIGTTTVSKNVTTLKLNEIQLEKNNHKLNERIKELTCLYTIFELHNDCSITRNELIQSSTETIPLGFQFPEITNCRIIIQGQEFIAYKNEKTNWSLNTAITVNGSTYGLIEVGYFAQNECKDPFLFEEAQLLEAIANILSKSLENNLTEENLKKNEENYRILFENVQDVFFKTSIKTKEILDVSPSCSNFNGITREELIGQQMAIIYPDKIEANIMFQQIVAEQKIIDYNNEIEINGKKFYVSINAKIIYNANGEPDFVVGSLRDITQRRLTEEKLKIREERFRAIYENFVDVYFLKDLNGTILDISPSVENYFQLKREDVIGQNCKDFYENHTDSDKFFETILHQGQVNDYEERFVNALGEIIYFSVNAKLRYDSEGNPAFVEGTMRNMNERINNQKQLEEAAEKIKESEGKFRSIYENMQDVYYIQDLTGMILDVSPSIEKHLQLKKQDVIGKYVRDFYVNPSQYDELKEIIHTKGFINDKEVPFITPSGESSYFSINGKVIFDANGTPTHVEGSMRNINERINNQKQLLEATEKIKESEEEFRAIFESFEDIYYKTTIDGIIQNISPSVEKILKYKREDLINTPSDQLYFNPEDRTKYIDQLSEKGYFNDFETVFKDGEGNPVYLSATARIVYDSLGNPLYSEGTLRDITERKKNEQEITSANEKIKESEKRYRTIFESVRDVFFRATAIDHKITDISPSCSYFDIQPEDIIGHDISSFYFNPEDRQIVLQELKNKGEIKNFDVKLLINSKTYTVSINSKIIYDQNNAPEYLIGSFRDVTDRIEAEENLKISEEKFRSIYENLEDVYFKTSLDGAILDVSPSFEKHFLLPQTQALKTTVSDFYYNVNDRQLLLEKLKLKGRVTDFDVCYKDGDGKPKFFSLNARFVYDNDGNPINIEGSMRNINDRKITQEEMIVKNRKLEFQNTELEQFAYIASHDLQEPLITVIHCSESLHEELFENLDEDQKQYLDFIRSSTARMQLLVKGLLDYSRIGKERETTQLNCNAIVTDVLSDMDVSIKESNAVIEYENLPTIEGNSHEMRQLFQNMISNAIKFRKKDSNPKVKIEAIKEKGNWLFSIADNGIGIHEEDQQKAFVIFKRLNNRSEYQGTGIGLSHCKKIIEQHHGKIWVESKFNEGSTFKWTLPLN